MQTDPKVFEIGDDPFYQPIGIVLYPHEDKEKIDFFTLVLNTDNDSATCIPALDEDYIVWVKNIEEVADLEIYFSRFAQDRKIRLDSENVAIFDLNDSTLFVREPEQFDYSMNIGGFINLFYDFLLCMNVEIPEKYVKIWMEYTSCVIWDSLDIREFYRRRNIDGNLFSESYFWLVGAIFANGKYL